MAPKLSLGPFNKIVGSSLPILERLVAKILALNETDRFYKQDVSILFASAKEIYDDAISKLDQFLSIDEPPPDIPVDSIKDAVEKLQELFLSAKVINNRATSVVPLANSTLLTTHLTPNLLTGEPALNTSVLNSSELPRLNIPTFDGTRPEAYNEFITKFLATIGDNPLLTPKQKLIHLTNHLKGAAYDKVTLLPVNDDSYSIALGTLQRRYQNKRLMSKVYCSKLLNLPRASINSPESIRDLVDHYSLNFAFLESLGCKETYETLYASYLLSHLDDRLRLKFEASQSESASLPKVSELVDFLTNQAIQQESARSPACTVSCWSNSKSNKQWQLSKPSSKGSNATGSTKGRTSHSLITTQGSTLTCGVCSAKHKVLDCPVFLQRLPRERYKLAKTNRLCISCLSKGHKTGSCGAQVKCTKCGSPHHTLLHFEDVVTPVAKRDETGECPVVASSCLTTTPTLTSILMSTCLVRLQINPGKFLIVRGVLDSASQVSFITESCAQRIGVKRFADTVQISGIGLSTPSPTKGSCHLAVTNLTGNIISQSHKFYILPNIAGLTPRVPISPKVMEAAKHLVLADPTFGSPARVDVLLGADLVAASLNGSPIVPLGEGMPLGVPTVFGYVLMGRAPVASPCVGSFSHPLPIKADMVQKQVHCCEAHYLNGCLCTLLSTTTHVVDAPGDEYISLVTSPSEDFTLDQSLKRFWELEEPPQVDKPVSQEEANCEAYFNSTTNRNPDGRYVVRLPFKEFQRHLLGDSYNEALSRFRSLERRFEKDPMFKDQYVNFMRDYQGKGHMVPIYDASFPKHFIPHHGIFKSHGETNKIRVVFDASHKTSSGYSLNDILMTGQGLQPLIADIITLFRRHRYVFCADIEQMFRQILVHLDDCSYQCILWRENITDPIQVMALLTVTYGVTSSPWHAIRTLRQLAIDEGEQLNKFLLAVRAIKDNSFVDDFACGADTLVDAQRLMSQLIDLLAQGGFVLKKWASNCPLLLADLSCEDKALKSPITVLGLRWDTQADEFSYPVKEIILPPMTSITKRMVLSQIARFYDPCGYIAPVILKAKCFLQTLWRESFSWDSPLPPDMIEQWYHFVESLENLEGLRMPRLMAFSQDVQLHGYSDASLAGYSAILYVCSKKGDSVVCRLLTAKCKVAPLKTQTIPRLELQGAYLLAKLVNHFSSLLRPQLNVTEIYLWTDSTITLNWIKTPPHLLKTFVANRVSQIVELTKGAHWGYVAGIENPADLASRGCDALAFMSCEAWFSGPPWLVLDSGAWPSQENVPLANPGVLELRKPKEITLVASNVSVELFSHISSWTKTFRVLALILKWLPRSRFKGLLTKLDIEALTHDYLMKHIQLSAFAKELSDIKHNKLVSASLQRLGPFIDEFGLMRARGRLTNSESFNSFPIILPKHHHLVHLLIAHTHIRLGHAGPQHVQYNLSLNYWILAARQVIRSVIFKCVRCFRVRPKSVPPLMSDLPYERVNPAPVFYNTGMDFCGYFLVKTSTLRKAPHIKVYVCIFICMTVKAVHLELALNLSTEAFIDALQRFIYRRGCPKKLFCDCGTNFLGADRSMRKDLENILRDLADGDSLKTFALENRIEFQFLPPASPSMGGLWERAVQSFKYHLKRVVGTSTLTVFQMSSLLVKIEGILNSRPITPLSAEPGDLNALSPGHFLIGRPIVAPVSPDVSVCQENTLDHYQLVQAYARRFWKRWQLEYLSMLQARSKWDKQTPGLMVGDLVVVEEPNTAPLQWPLGRVTQIFPSADGTVRKAEVKTASGLYTRPAIKLYMLPLPRDSMC